MRRETWLLIILLLCPMVACTRPTEPSITTPPPTVTATMIEPMALHQEPDEEKRIIATAAPTPSFSDLPDLTRPLEGWIAFETSEEQLALVSPDGSRPDTVPSGSRRYLCQGTNR